MASISKRGNGWILRYIDQRGERKTITLNTESERQATQAKLKIENLLSAIQTNTTPDPETAAWLAKLQADKSKFARRLLPKLAAAGLLGGPRADTAAQAPPAVLTIGQFLANYIRMRTDVKPATRVNWGHTERNLIAFFGADKPLNEITVGDAKDFERYLKTTARTMRYADAAKSDKLNPATRNKRISNAKQFFQDAVDRRLIPTNPFAGLDSGNSANKEREFFVTLDMAQAVLEACPNTQWKLIFALCRFGGLRCPSEVEKLRVEDVNWEKNRFLVRSPKTEHHEGKATRWVPIFPELEPYLSEVWHQAEPGQKYLVTALRGKSNGYAGTMMGKILRRAGLAQWPKLLQNLRSSRQTELEDAGFPSHVVCAWIGNSTRVARKHYLQVTEDHFHRATVAPAARSIFVATPAGNTPQDVASFPVTPRETLEKSQGIAKYSWQVGVTGLEPVTPSMSRKCASQLR